MLKNKFFAGILKVNDENSRIRIQDPDPNPDPLVRGMDPRIRIRIHLKISWIRYTVSRTVLFSQRPKNSLPSDEGDSFLRTPSQKPTQKSNSGKTRTGLLETPSQKSTNHSLKSTKASSSEEETESQLLSSLPLSVLDIKVSV